VAIEGVPELHVPPLTVLLKFIVAPGHTVVPPEITDGGEYTVTVAVVEHPPGAK